jgi:hypothetical protein
MSRARLSLLSSIVLATFACVLLCFTQSRRREELSPVSDRSAQVRVAPFDMAIGDKNAALAQINKALARGGLSLRVTPWGTEPLPASFHQLMRGVSRTQPSLPLEASLTGSTVREDCELGTVLHDFCFLYDGAVGQKGRNLFLMPVPGTFAPILHRTYRNAHGLMSGAPASGPATPPAISDPVAYATDYLAASGVAFYDGTYAELTPRGDLVVNNVEEEIDLCDAIFNWPSAPSLYARVKWWCLRVWEGPLHGKRFP